MKASQRRQSRFRAGMRDRILFNTLKPVLMAAMERAVHQAVKDLLKKRFNAYFDRFIARGIANPYSYEGEVMKVCDVEAVRRDTMELIEQIGPPRETVNNGNEVQG